MNAIDERAIREQLERAVSVLDPVAPPLDTLRTAGTRRRRQRLALGAGLATGVAAIVVALIVVVPGGGPKSVTIGSPPSRDSLTTFAAAHAGKHVAGPIKSSSGYYGAYAVKQGIQVVRYLDQAWRAQGRLVTAYGPGRWVERLTDAGGVVQGSPAFEMRYRGGDVSYFGGVLYLADENSGQASWRAARFDRCDVKGLSCEYRGTTQPYGHVVNGNFVSMHNDCTPYCAAGHLYRVTWRWNSTTERFEVAAAHRAGRWADRP